MLRNDPMCAHRYIIRSAAPRDLPLLPAIEHAAAAIFRATPYAWLAGDEHLVSADVDLAHEHVWVVVADDDQPVAFAIAHLLDGVAHLHELDVHPAHARQGLGRRLIDVVAEWARTEGSPALTLTTFADIPWNAPYYARLGFRRLDPDRLSPALVAVLAEEVASGLPAATRVAMQRDL